MKIFTISNGIVTEGARVQKIVVKDFSYYGIKVGEYGRGRHIATLPVDERALNLNPNSEQGDGEIFIKNASLGTTRSGAPKLFSEDVSSDDCLIVFRTTGGYRGSAHHTGDRQPEWTQEAPSYFDFPGKIVCSGEIAEGAAGRMGGNSQPIAIMPKGAIFRVSRTGRLYGHDGTHYYMWNGEKLLGGLTWEERTNTDAF